VATMFSMELYKIISFVNSLKIKQTLFLLKTNLGFDQYLIRLDIPKAKEGIVE
jgi:hypothetical protein